MHSRIFIALVLLRVAAGDSLFWKFFGEDSAVIVDTDKKMVLPAKPRFSHNSVYETNQHATSLTPTKDELPADLLEIANTRLGIRKLDEIPTISELGELLGTESAEETINYLRELTSTENGIALVKAFIESSDYTDSTVTKTSSPSPALLETTTPTPSPLTSTPFPATSPQTEMISKSDDFIPEQGGGYIERISNLLTVFMNCSGTSDEKETDSNKVEQKDLISTTASPSHASPTTDALTKIYPHKPIFLRNPLPYHYPIPIRPVPIYHPAHHMHMQRLLHLNSPRVRLQHQKHNGRKVTPRNQRPPPSKESAMTMTPKTSNTISKFDKLAEEVSTFPIANKPAIIDSHDVAVAPEEKAYHDEGIKKLLNASETLK